MPITRRQLDLGIDEALIEWMELVHRFLSKHRDQAFTAEEIEDALRPDVAEFYQKQRLSRGIPEQDGEVVLVPPPIRPALTKLLEVFAIDTRRLHGWDYYAYSEDLPDLR
jgi:hypothetical protein